MRRTRAVSPAFSWRFDCPGGHPIAQLGLGESVTCSGSYAITQADIDAGEKVNTATVEASEGGPQQGANRASAQSMVQVMIPQQPTILLVKTGTADLGPDGVADPGDTIDYELVVANEGNVTLTNVAISDPMLPVLTCPSGNPIPTMAPGATETCSGTYTITAADIDAGVVNNNAEASGQDPMTQTVVAGATATMDLAPMAPSLGVWGLIALALVLAAAGALTLRRRDVTA